MLYLLITIFHFGMQLAYILHKIWLYVLKKLNLAIFPLEAIVST